MLHSLTAFGIKFFIYWRGTESTKGCETQSVGGGDGGKLKFTDDDHEPITHHFVLKEAWDTIFFLKWCQHNFLWPRMELQHGQETLSSKGDAAFAWLMLPSTQLPWLSKFKEIHGHVRSLIPGLNPWWVTATTQHHLSDLWVSKISDDSGLQPFYQPGSWLNRVRQELPDTIQPGLQNVRTTKFDHCNGYS